MTQMKGGLNSRGCAGPPLPRDFGHFASPSWLTTKKKKKSTMNRPMRGKKQENGVSWNLCMNE